MNLTKHFTQGITEKTAADYMKRLGADMTSDLTERIGAALTELPPLDACTSEVVSHVAFGEKRAKVSGVRSVLQDLDLRVLGSREKMMPVRLQCCLTSWTKRSIRRQEDENLKENVCT